MSALKIQFLSGVECALTQMMLMIMMTMIMMIVKGA